MVRTAEKLTAGEWALLGLLDEGPAHAFVLARQMAPDGEVGQIWTIRRPLVYRAIETLDRLSLVRPLATLPSSSGPPRTLIEPTPDGRRAFTSWLEQPVEHVRDGRSLLLLKLLFIARRGGDATPLLRAQRAQFSAVAEGLSAKVAAAAGIQRQLFLWRLQSTNAAIQFADALLNESPANPSIETRTTPVRPDR